MLKIYINLIQNNYVKASDIMTNNTQLPDYNRSILSISSSIMKYYNVKSNYKSLPELDNILNNHYQNIIYLILDCLGDNI